MKSRVRLRDYKDKDFEFLHGLLSDPATKKYFPFMYTVEREQTFIRLRTRQEDRRWGRDTLYLIEDKKLRKAVGEVSGRPAKDDPTCMEIAILVHPDFRGQGYAKEGAFEFIKLMREIKPEIAKFRMEIEESNLASQAMAKKLEFVLKGSREIGRGKTKMLTWEDK